MSWHIGRLVAFDTETTGVDYENDRIVTASTIAIGGVQPAVPATWLINPGVDIPAGATEVHGITTEQARAEGGDPAEAVNEIAYELSLYLNAGLPLVAMNARFDLTLLDRECRRHGVEPLADRCDPDGVKWSVIDPLIIDKQADRWRKGSRTLTALCEHYGVELANAHDSTADALASVGVARALGTKYKQLRVDAWRLHAWQVQWAAAQAASFQEYKRRNGEPDIVIEGAWPQVPFAGVLA